MAIRNQHNFANAKERLKRFAPLVLILVAMVAKLGAAGLGFVLSIFLARTISLTEFGAFAFGLAIASTLSVFASFGLPFATVRYLPTFLARGEVGKARVFERLVVRYGLVGGFIGALALACFAWSQGLGTHVGWALLAAAPLSLVLTLIVCLSAIMQGRQRAIQAELGGNFVRALLSVAFVLVIYATTKEVLDGGTALLAVAVSGALSCLVLCGMLWRVRLDDGVVAKTELDAGERRVWMRTGFAVLLILSGSVLNERVDVLMVTALAGLEQAGLYSAAAKISLVLTLGFAGLSSHLAPKLASAWGLDDRQTATIILLQAAQVGAVVVGVLAIILGALAKPLLGLFGPEYVQATSALIVLLCAQWFVASFGLTGALVVLSGHEKVALVATVSGLAANIALNGALVPHFGAQGAAYATLLGLGCVQFGLSIWCWRTLELSTSIFWRLTTRQSDAKKAQK